MNGARNFEITVLGATGWTATICAHHVAKTQPTNLTWCIAGRSAHKLQQLADNLSSLYPDRKAPEIAIVPSMDDPGLIDLVRNTRVLINGVGPYHRYSTPVVEACAKNGTHYVDFSTETLWIAEMVERFHADAQHSGAVMIPAISLSSAPSDLVAWLIVNATKDDHQDAHVAEVVCSGRLDMIGMQGGSFETVLGVMGKYGIGWQLHGDSWIMTTQQKPASVAKGVSVFGYRSDPVLGPLATSFVAKGNASVVQRSAGLDPQLYGRDFVFKEYMPTSGFFGAALIHVVTKLGIFLLAIPWVRSLLRRLAFAPGTGPDREESRAGEGVEFTAVGYSSLPGTKPVAKARFAYKGALVDISAILAVEAAATLLAVDQNGRWQARGRGLVTPSTLGMPLIERLKSIGVVIDVEVL